MINYIGRKMSLLLGAVPVVRANLGYFVWQRGLWPVGPLRDEALWCSHEVKERRLRRGEGCTVNNGVQVVMDFTEEK